jgi:hypothetical protein
VRRLIGGTQRQKISGLKTLPNENSSIKIAIVEKNSRKIHGGRRWNLEQLL